MDDIRSFFVLLFCSNHCSEKGDSFTFTFIAVLSGVFRKLDIQIKEMKRNTECLVHNKPTGPSFYFIFYFSSPPPFNKC